MGDTWVPHTGSQAVPLGTPRSHIECAQVCPWRMRGGCLLPRPVQVPLGSSGCASRSKCLGGRVTVPQPQGSVPSSGRCDRTLDGCCPSRGEVRGAELLKTQWAPGSSCGGQAGARPWWTLELQPSLAALCRLAVRWPVLGPAWLPEERCSQLPSGGFWPSVQAQPP